MKLRKKTKTLFLCLFCAIIFALSAVGGTLAAYKTNNSYTISGETGGWLVEVTTPSGDITDSHNPFFDEVEIDYDEQNNVTSKTGSTSGVTFSVEKKTGTDVAVDVAVTIALTRQSFGTDSTNEPYDTLPAGVYLRIARTDGDGAEEDMWMQFNNAFHTVDGKQVYKFGYDMQSGTTKNTPAGTSTFTDHFDVGTNKKITYRAYFFTEYVTLAEDFLPYININVTASQAQPT